MKFFCCGALVGIGNAGAQVGIQLAAKQGGGVPVNRLAARMAQGNFVQHFGVSVQYAGVVHHFAQRGHVGVVHEGREIRSLQNRAAVFKGRSRNTRRQCEKNIQRQGLGAGQQKMQSRRTAHVGQLVRVGHHRGCAVGQGHLGKAGRGHHARF